MRINHISRDQNELADEIAKIAVRKRCDSIEFDAPDEVCSLANTHWSAMEPYVFCNVNITVLMKVFHMILFICMYVYIYTHTFLFYKFAS